MTEQINNSSQKTIELISFKLCPFVQRSVITLLKKDIDFKITYIDLANKPDWFLKISPLGKVPVVRYGNEVLFESAIINEFLDEITSDQIMPTDPLQKAKDRGWIEYSSQTIMSQYMMTAANNQADYEKHSSTLSNHLQKLENTISDQDFFNGNSFSLIDSALAPLFTRFNVYKKHFNQNFLSAYPKLTTLAEKLTSLDYVKQSVVADFENIYVDYLGSNDSYLVTQ